MGTSAGGRHPIRIGSRVVDLESGRFDDGGTLRPVECRLLRYPASIRAFAEVHGDPEARRSAERRHGEHFASGPVARIDRAQGMVAWERALARGDVRIAEALALALTLEPEAYPAEPLIQRLEQTLALPGLVRAPLVRASLGTLLGVAGRIEEADQELAQAIGALAEDPAQDDRRALMMTNRAVLLGVRGRHTEHEQLVRAALEIARSPKFRGLVSLRLGNLLGEAGQREEAVALLGRVYADLDPEISPRGVGLAGTGLSGWLLDLGRVEEGRPIADRVLELAVEREMADLEADARSVTAAYALFVDGERERARFDAQLARQHDQRVDNRLSGWRSELLLGEVALADGRLDEALELALRVVRQGSTFDLGQAVHDGSVLAADVHLAATHPDLASAAARRALDAGRERAWGAEQRLAAAARLAGDLALAVRWVDAGLARTPTVQGVGRLRIELARIRLAQDRARDAQAELERAAASLIGFWGDDRSVLLAVRVRVLVRTVGLEPARQALEDAVEALGDRTAGPVRVEVDLARRDLEALAQRRPVSPVSAARKMS